MSVLQEVLFPFEELLDFSPYESLKKLFDQINYSPLKQLIHWGRGRKGHNKVAMLQTFVAKEVLQIKTVSGLIQALRRDIVLRLLCGFNLGLPLPHPSTFSRFFATLSQNPDIINAIFNGTLENAVENTSSLGLVAIDSTDIEAYENVYTNQKAGVEEIKCAAFGHRTASTGESEFFYGYKVHTAALITEDGPLPLCI